MFWKQKPKRKDQNGSEVSRRNSDFRFKFEVATGVQEFMTKSKE